MKEKLGLDRVLPQKSAPHKPDAHRARCVGTGRAYHYWPDQIKNIHNDPLRVKERANTFKILSG